MEGHITTDKVVYRPNDVIFAEVYLIDAFTKVPVQQEAEDTFFINLFFTMDILDPNDNVIYTTQTEAQESTVSFTYKIPESATGGQYLMKVSNYQMATVYQVLRVRSYVRDQLIVNGTFEQNAYFPGDTVRGNLKVSNSDGSPLQESLTFSLSVNLGEDTVSLEQLQMN